MPLACCGSWGNLLPDDLDVSPGIFRGAGINKLLVADTRRKGELWLPPDAPSRWKALLDFLEVQENNTSFDVITD